MTIGSGATLAGNGGVGGLNIGLEGTHGPGASAGLTEVAGDYEMLGTLEIELGGLDEAEFDRVVVGGAATLSGVLEVALIDGFELGFDQRFEFLSAGSVSGVFAGLGDGALVGSFGGMDLFIEYGDGGVSLVTVVIPEPMSLALLGLGGMGLLGGRRRGVRGGG